MIDLGEQNARLMEGSTEMDYKIIVLDLDGTLTNRDKIITPRTREALMKIQDMGKIVVLASGRPTHGVMPLARELRHVALIVAVEKAEEGQQHPQHRRQRRHGDEQGLGHPPGGRRVHRLLQLLQGQAQLLRPA